MTGSQYSVVTYFSHCYMDDMQFGGAIWQTMMNLFSMTVTGWRHHVLLVHIRGALQCKTGRDRSRHLRL